MLVYTNAKFKPKKRRKVKGEVARKINKNSLRGTEMPTLTYVPRPAAEYARQCQSLKTTAISTGRKESMVYSGERKLLGIATMHKSNMVPVFSSEEATEIARMRRG
jgi:hypothetical protein